MLDRGSAVSLRRPGAFCASQRSVAGSVNPFAVRLEQADAECAFNLHIIAKGAREMDALEIAGSRAQAFEKQLESRRR